jgi:dimethylamine--corrinoid protein Co-methyltransferase
MPKHILTRMGDGERVSMPADEVKEELLLGTRDAAQNGEIPQLTPDDLEQLFEILAEPGRVVSVPPGDEVVVTDDGCAKLFCSGPADGGAGLPISRQTSILAYERGFAADTVSIGHEDYSFMRRHWPPPCPFSMAPNPISDFTIVRTARTRTRLICCP